MAIDQSSSEWLFFKRGRSGLRRGQSRIDWERELITTENNAYPGFDKLRIMALEIIQEYKDIVDLQKAILILAITGKKEDVPMIQKLEQMGNKDLSIDIKTCVYEIRHSVGSE
jgi:hypothetical protein